jgi:hypothetical protein
MGEGIFSRAMGRVAVSGLVSLGPTAAFAQDPPAEWTLSIGARESKEFSRVFSGVPEEDLILDNVNLGLAYNSRTERSQYGLFGRAGANAYREGDHRNQFNYGAGFSWSHTPSARFSSTLTFGADRGFQAETLSNLGVLAPGMDSSAAHASWGLQYRTSPRTTFSSSISYDYIRFESDQPIPGSQIVLGQTPFRDEFPRLFPGRPDHDEIPLPDPEGGVIDILATEGFLLGASGSHSGTAIFGVSRQLSEYSSFGLDLGGGYRTIDRGDRGDARFLQEGAQGAFRFWAQRRAGRSSTFGTSYEVGRSLILDPATTIQTLSGGYGFAPEGRNVSLRLIGGASHYLAENGISSITPVVDGTFAAGLSRTTELNILYRRQYSLSLGYGTTLLIDYASMSLTQQFGSKVDLTLSGGASFGTDPLIEDSRYDAAQAGGTLSYKVVESFVVGTSFFVLRTEQSAFFAPSETKRNLLSLFVAYTATWR